MRKYTLDPILDILEPVVIGEENDQSITAFNETTDADITRYESITNSTLNCVVRSGNVEPVFVFIGNEDQARDEVPMSILTQI